MHAALSARAGHRARAAALWFAACCAGSGALYALWMASWWVNPGLDVLNGYVSELSARDQPGSTLFRTGDAVAGLLAVAAAALGARDQRQRWALVGWGGLAVFGASTMIDVTWTPMDCATFIDSGCAVRELVGTVSLPHELHAATSSLAIAGALVAMGALGLAARDVPVAVPPRAAWTWFSVTAFATVATLVALMGGSWAGVAQRLQVLAISTWLVALAVRAVRPR